MANITAQMVKELRESTGAGMMDCKAALTETNGEMTAAQDWLRKKGLSKAAKKAGRVAAEGLVGAAAAGAVTASSCCHFTRMALIWRTRSATSSRARSSRVTSMPIVS